ncbi:peptide chain release factor 1 [candidate division TA06 bacterium]|uniref:Peptide chain release factor 1 n=1 Tax=candidate division TA06 bacterium TaxID=2250710 RepID=A0A933IED9_UNCT6|nr:peptide chain release factor 1 [candidate division TA06 bacterium]
MDNKLEQLEKRYKELEGLLSDPGVLANQAKFRDYAREHRSLGVTISKYDELKSLRCQIEDSRVIAAANEDPELTALAKTELEELEPRLKSLEEVIKAMLMPKDSNDFKNAIVEVRAGTGGEEAALFAGDLYRLYTRFAERKGFKIDLMNSNPTPLGGFKEVTFGVEGEGAYGLFKYESGVHRVQRVPRTEASGRIHTSASTVAVMPEAEEVDIQINPSDLKIDIYCSSGPGGQCVNTTYSAVRLTHIPTGVVVACQDERSQMKNKAKALKILRSRVLEKMEADRHAKLAQDRKSQVKSGDRSEKIRTYNFPQNRVTDHRIGVTLHSLDQVLEGHIDQLVDGLIKAAQAEELATALE